MNRKTNVVSTLGLGLIIMSLAGFALLSIPIVSVYLYPPKLQPVSPKGAFVTIPKIHASAPIIMNVDPWDEGVYRKALQAGVAHAEGTKKPGEKGTIFLFAHSSGTPWDMARYNTIFLRLPELTKGDLILITVDGKRYKYKVTNKKEVSPTNVSYLVNSTPNQLILQTCTPIGTAINRLLVFATPV